jgi:diadenosine tetraphosphate (Ap4A) HIT family hydrolase
MNNCEFCAEFEKGNFGLNGIEDRILYKSDNFVVFPSVGQIVEGYLLITSKDHYISMGAVPEQLHAELESVEDKVRNVLGKVYTTPLFFEHGPISDKNRGGSCIDHAHFHCVPVDIDIVEDLSRTFPYEQISSFKGLTRIFEHHVPYFFVEENKDRYVFNINFPVFSQYIRRLIADKIGKPERGDWRNYPGYDEMKRVIERLRPEFK